MPRRSRSGGAPASRNTALDQIRARAVEILGVDAPLTSAGLSTVLLGMTRGSEAACRTLLDPILGTDPRFHADASGRWSLSEAAPAYATSTATEPLHDGAWVVWVFDPSLHTLAGARLEGGTCTATVRVSTRTLAPRALERLSRFGGGAHWITTASLLPRPRARARAHAGAVRALRDGDVLARLPRARADLDFDRVTLDLGRIAGLVCDARPRSLAALAACLDLPARTLDDPLDLAVQAAECWLALLDRPAVRAMSLSRLIETLTRRPRPFDLDGRDFDAAFLQGLPEDPGAYRFFDPEGELVYVGKAKNLRRRVGSYFAARSKPDPRTASWISRVHRIEIETTGSELQALLREAELIARKNPLANVQRKAHSREPRRGRARVSRGEIEDLASHDRVIGPISGGSRTKGGDLVLLLPDRSPGVTRAYCIRNGALAARLTLGPKARGLSALRKRLERLYFRPASDVAPRAPTKAQHRDRAILASWLARQPGTLSAFDPTEAPTASAAAELSFRYARSLQAGETGVLHRHRPMG